MIYTPNPMTYSLSGKGDGCLAAHKIQRSLCNPTFLMFTTAYHWTLFWTRGIQSIHTQGLNSHFSIILPSILHTWSHVASYHQIQLKFLPSLMHATCPTHHIILNLITLKQECTNPNYQIATVTKFCMVAPTSMERAPRHTTGT